MADDRLAQERNVGPGPVKPEPNQYREKTYDAPNPPEKVVDEKQKLPEKTAEAKVESGMDDAVDGVKEKL